MPPPPSVRVHGTKGAYVGGEWVDIEDCPKLYNIEGGSACSGCAACPPRSRTRNCAARADGTYDVVIIGAGAVGAAVARELSKTQAAVLLIEAADDVSQGASKGNSGIVHAGFDDKPGTARARCCWPGNQMFPQLDRELHFGYELTGSLVVATSADERKVLDELMDRGATNGVKNLRIVEKEELREMEPEVNANAVAALYAPDAGNLIPYEYVIALAENAVDNGVEMRLRREVEAIEKTDIGFDIRVRHWEPAAYVAHTTGPKHLALLTSSLLPLAMLAAMKKALPLATLGVTRSWPMGLVANAVAVGCGQLLLWLHHRFSKPKGKTIGAGAGVNIAPWVGAMAVGGTGAPNAVNGTTVGHEVVRARHVVNCAGVASDKVAQMIGDDSFKIKPRLGEYLLLNKSQGHRARHIIFPTPHPVLGKGVLVQRTLWGNLILGPTARDVCEEATAKETIQDITSFILRKCSELVPTFEASETIHSFSGARAKSTRGDWIIEASAADPRGQFVHAAGIDSPGLAGSPAIALEVVELLRKGGLVTEPDPNFNPNRAPIIMPKTGAGLKYTEEFAASAGVDPKMNVICKCEKVTEAEIVEALHRSLPIDSTQALRKRTRAGMGHCQASPENYDCEARVAAIIARETGLPLGAVGRRPWPGTSTLPQRWLTDAQKMALSALSATQR